MTHLRESAILGFLHDSRKIYIVTQDKAGTKQGDIFISILGECQINEH